MNIVLVKEGDLAGAESDTIYLELGNIVLYGDQSTCSAGSVYDKDGMVSSIPASVAKKLQELLTEVEVLRTTAKIHEQERLDMIKPGKLLPMQARLDTPSISSELIAKFTATELISLKKEGII